ncbi:MAG: hypothetical protein ACRDI2_02230 [Chloroflexota bacterium]
MRAPDAARRWTAQTAAYIYRLDAVAPEQPIVAYHWHPHVESIPFPHVHALAGPPAVQRLHIATPPCTLKDVLTCAMRDFDVRPLRSDWSRDLVEAEAALLASMERP